MGCIMMKEVPCRFIKRTAVNQTKPSAAAGAQFATLSRTSTDGRSGQDRADLGLEFRQEMHDHRHASTPMHSW